MPKAVIAALDAAAPSDLHRIAELAKAGRLADETMVGERLPSAASHASTFTVPLIAGPSSSPVSSSEIGSRESRPALGGEVDRGCHESGDRSLHVARPAPDRRSPAPPRLRTADGASSAHLPAARHRYGRQNRNVSAPFRTARKDCRRRAFRVTEPQLFASREAGLSERPGGVTGAHRPQPVSPTGSGSAP